MGLQFVFGGSGAGKSTKVYEKIVQQSMRHPQQNFLIMVPDQFTMSTQKELCLMHPHGGIMNIDVLSFSRLIYRIAQEVGQKERVVLDDTGKNLILRKVALQKEEELVLLKEKLKKTGYLHEVKSMISEFYQYDIHKEDLDEMIVQAEGKGSLSWKLRDLRVLYDGFAEYIKEKFITTEEALEDLCHMIPKSEALKGSVIVFDGFTGFTPIQCRVLVELMQVAEEVIVTLCADNAEDIVSDKGEQHLFALSRKTYDTLVRFAQKYGIAVRSNMFLSDKPVKRYEKNQAMAFLEANLFRYHNTVFEKEQEAVHVVEAETPLEELQSVCFTIKELIRTQDLCYRDIAVVTGDIGRYAHLFETEFARYDIPFFMDQNRGVAYHPMTEYLKGALGIWKEQFSYESVFRFLRSGMTSVSADEADRLENYVRAQGIRGRKAYERMFVRTDQAEEMNKIREKLMCELEPLRLSCKNAREFVMAVYQLCEKSNLQGKCNEYARMFESRGELSNAKEYEKIYPACMDLLNQIYELIGEDEMDVEEFTAIFEAGISEIQIGTIPQSVDQVVVGDIERTRLKKIKVLFFMGVNDGVIPGNGSSGGLLSDMERQFLIDQGRELAPTPRQKIFEQRLYLYQNMTKPTERLYLSYYKVDGSGKSALPSYLIRVIRTMYPALEIRQERYKKAGNLASIATKEDALDDFATLLRMYLNEEVPQESEEGKEVEEALRILCRAYGKDAVANMVKKAALTTYENQPLSEIAAQMLYQERNKGSVSRLEMFASCAYAHFLRYGLELSQKEEYEFDALDFGNVYHFVLEYFSHALKEEGIRLAEAKEEEIKRLLDKAMEECVVSYGENILYSSARNEYRITQMKRVLMQSIRAMQYQLLKGDFEPAYFEKSFRLNGKFPLIGKIDRIDLCREDGKILVKVMDYKSGTKKFSLEELYYGLSLQLPVYMSAAMRFLKEENREKELIPASMLYYKLQNPYVDDSAADTEIEWKKKMRPQGLTADADEVIAHLDRELNGESDVICIGRKKDGSLKSSSQTTSGEDIKVLLDFTDRKIEQLMEEIGRGEIGIKPVHVENEQYDSCSFCKYHEICRMDMRIPGYQKKELPKITQETIKEEMEHAVYSGSAEGYIDEK